MIVKNEEDNLYRSISSIQKFIDQIILVDTGSSDNTISIAKKLKCDIYNYKWDDNFASAKNYAIDKVTGDWILFLDADEEFEAGSSSKLRETIKIAEDSNYESILILLRNINKFGKYSNELHPLRIWKNKNSVRYKNPIHEVLQNYKKPALKSDLVVRHYGYGDISSDKKAEKNKRNFKILKGYYNKNQKNSKVCWELGREYCSIGEFQNALPYLNEAVINFGTKNTIPYQYPLYQAYALFGLEEYKKAQEILYSTLKIYPNNLEMLILQGKLFFKQKKWKRSIKSLTLYLEKLNQYKKGEILQDIETLDGIFDENEVLKIINWAYENLQKKEVS